jgi:hypothetical protein
MRDTRTIPGGVVHELPEDLEDALRREPIDLLDRIGEER